MTDLLAGWLTGLPHAGKTVWLVSHSYCHQLLAMVVSKLFTPDIFRQDGNASRAALRPWNISSEGGNGKKKFKKILARNTKDATHSPNWVFWKQCCGWAPEKWAHKCNQEDWIVTGVSGDIIVIYLAEVFWFYRRVEEWTWNVLAKHVCFLLNVQYQIAHTSK